ncbi:MAG TPA: ricin-type beta-trefoil lectin domain protein [Mycobacteriales bacterium]|nr:ricin-type beta-trefoil lectin domain protein [Mycobacteriales bacterium]
MSDPKYFYLVCGSTGLVVAPEGGGTATGTRLVLATARTGPEADSQLWSVTADRSLRHRQTGMVIDYRTVRNNPVVLWTQNAAVSPNQKWTLGAGGTVTCDLHGVVLGVAEAVPGAVVEAVVAGNAGFPLETWQFPDTAPLPPYFHLRYGRTGLVIAPQVGTVTTGTKVVLAEMVTGPGADAQLWTLTGARTLRHKQSGLVIDYETARNTPVVLWTQNAAVSPNQKWTLTADGTVTCDLHGVVLGAARDAPGAVVEAVVPDNAGFPLEHWQVVEPRPADRFADARYFFLHSGATNLVLALDGGQTAPGTAVVLAARASGQRVESQLWTLTPNGYLRHKQTGLVADVFQDNPAPGTGLVAWTPNGGKNQNWTLTADGQLLSGLGDLVVTVAGDTLGSGVAVRTAMPVTGSAAQTWRVARDIPPVRIESGRALSLDGTAQAVTVPAPDFRDDDLTVEAWVRTTAGGPVLASTGDLDNPAGLAVAIGPDGSLFFGMLGVVQPGVMMTTTGPTPVLDGEWHHLAAVRHGTTGLVYLDGTAVPALTGAQNTAVPFRPVMFAEQSDLLLGQAVPSTALGTQPSLPLPGVQFTGELDAVRVWARALGGGEIAAGMHHLVPDTERDLLGQWSFDNDDAADSSPYGRHGTLTGEPAFVDSEVELVGRGEPYLITQARLTQDWVSAPAGTTGTTGLQEITGYRVVVSMRDSSDQPLSGYLTLWSDQPVTLHFGDGTSAQLAGGDTGCTRATDLHGELGFAIDAAGALTCPAVKVRADFMGMDERVLVYPDRQAHAVLATVTGNTLLGQDEAGNPLPSVAKNRRPAPVPAGTDPRSADAVAKAIGHVLSTAVRHGVQSDRSQTQTRALPEDLPAPRPYLPRYQHVSLVDQGVDHTSDAIATHFLDADQPVVRVLVPEDAPTPHWTYDHAGASFRAMSPAEVATVLGTLEVTHLDDYTAAFRLDPDVFTGKRTISMPAADLRNAARGELAKRWFGGDFLDEVENAAAVVVTTVDTVVTDAVDEATKLVQTIVVTVVTEVTDAVTGLTKAFDAVLQTVEHAVDFVGAILKKVGAAIQDVIDFLRSLFEWEDILVAQEVIEKYFVESRAVLSRILHGAGDRAAEGIASFRTMLDTNFTAWRRELNPGTMADQSDSAGGASPPDIKSKYVTSMFSHNLGSLTAGASLKDEFETLIGSVANDLTTALAPFTARAPGLLDIDGLLAATADPATLFGAGVDLLLRVVQTVTDAALDVAENVVHTVMAALDSLLDVMYQMATTRIEIPVLTTFYEKVVMLDNGSQLTMASLVALAAAIPLTITYKALTGSDDPVFSPADHDAFMSMSGSDYTWIRDPFTRLATRSTSGSPSDDALLWLSRAGLFASAVSTFIWGTVAMLSDALWFAKLGGQAGETEVRYLKPFCLLTVTGQLGCVVFGLPVTAGDDQAGVAAWVLWAVQIPPVLSNAVGSVVNPWVRTGANLTAGCGFAAIAILAWMLAARADGDDDDPVADAIVGTKVILLNTARIAQVFKNALGLDLRIALAVLLTDSICYRGVVLATLAEVVYSIVTVS